MNYLSHYYVADCPSNANYTFGLLLPDFVRKQTAKFRLPNEKIPTLSANSQLFHQGVLCHYKADELFHQSDFFKKHLANIQQVWKSCEFEQLHKYKFFLAHVLLEMMLDRLLLQTKPTVCKRFYQHLANIEKKEYNKYVSAMRLSKGVAEKVFFDYEQFIKKRYLMKYLDKEKLINGLNYVYERVTHLNISYKDKCELISSLVYIEEAMQADYQKLYFDLKNELSIFFMTNF